MKKTNYTVDNIIRYLKAKLPKARLNHVKGTTRAAFELAAVHKAPLDKAILAALLHDCAKWMSKPALAAYVKKYRVGVPELGNVLKYNPSLLHGYVGAHLAKKLFGINDKDILGAISLHTLGSRKMTKLAKIIYLADITSPDRRYNGLDNIRRASRQNLDRAMQLAVGAKISFVIKKAHWLHPETIAAWNSLLDA